MSVAPVAKRSMRILALPLVAASKHSRTDGVASTHLTYYHFATPPPREDKGQSWAQWASDKAAGLWGGFGKAPEGTWKVLLNFHLQACFALQRHRLCGPGMRDL